ncbi:hypothetical protein R3I94_002482 [Phoxinus phoxinus]
MHTLAKKTTKKLKKRMRSTNTSNYTHGNVSAKTSSWVNSPGVEKAE